MPLPSRKRCRQFDQKRKNNQSNGNPAHRLRNPVLRTVSDPQTMPHSLHRKRKRQCKIDDDKLMITDNEYKSNQESNQEKKRHC